MHQGHTENSRGANGQEGKRIERMNRLTLAYEFFKPDHGTIPSRPVGSMRDNVALRIERAADCRLFTGVSAHLPRRSDG